MFTSGIINSFCEISLKHESKRDVIVDKVLDFFIKILNLVRDSDSDYVSRIGFPVVQGLVDGIGKLPCGMEKINSVVFRKCVEFFKNKEFAASILKAAQSNPASFHYVLQSGAANEESLDELIYTSAGDMLTSLLDTNAKMARSSERVDKDALDAMFNFASDIHKGPNAKLYGASLTQADYKRCVRLICACVKLMIASCSQEQSLVVLRLLKNYLKADDSTEVDYVHVLVVCLDGLVALGQKFPDLLNLIIDSTFHFLINSSSVLMCNPDFVLVKEKTFLSVTRIMDQGLLHDRNNVDAFVSRLANKLYIIDSEEEDIVKMNESVGENVVVSLGCLTQTLHDPKIYETCCRIFQRRLAEPPSPLDASIVEQLSCIAVHGDEKTYSLITEQFLVISKDLSNPKYKFCQNEITSGLMKIASSLENENLLHDLLSKLLKLFVHIGNEIQLKSRNREHNASSMAGNLGILIPVLSAVISRIDSIVDPKASIITLFRHTWFYCVIFGFVNPTMWMDEWYEGVKVLASKSPALIVTKAQGHLDQELELNSVLEIGKKDQTSAEEVASFRKQLDKLLNNNALSRIIYSASMAQCSYLLALYHLESMRAEFGSFILSFSYLKDKGVRSTEIAPVVDCVVDRVFAIFLKKQVDTPGGMKRTKIWETILGFYW